MKMKLVEWAHYYGVHPKTAYRWYCEGIMPFPVEKVGARTIVVTMPDKEEETVAKTVIYARVSSHDQKEDLDRQVARLLEYAVENQIKVSSIEKEIASGLNENRPKLNKLLKDKDITNILVEHKDRLGRHNVQPIISALESTGRTILIANTEETEEDLVTDVLAVLTSYAAKMYGKRSAKNRAKKAVKALEDVTEND